jgi:hypothetical protein
MANNETQYEPELIALAATMGKTVEELMAVARATQALLPREEQIAQATITIAGLTPEEEALQKERLKVEADNLINQAFTTRIDIPDQLLEYAKELFDGGQWPSVVELQALVWPDKISTEMTYGRFIYGDSNTVCFPKRLSNARRRGFVPNAEFGVFTLFYKKTKYEGNDGIKALLKLTNNVVVGDNNAPTYLHRACKALANKKAFGDDGLMFPADIQVWHPMIMGCTPIVTDDKGKTSGGQSTLLTRYFEHFENHTPDIANGVVLTKDGHFMALEDYTIPNGTAASMPLSSQEDGDDLPSDGQDELSDEPEEN